MSIFQNYFHTTGIIKTILKINQNIVNSEFIEGIKIKYMIFTLISTANLRLSEKCLALGIEPGTYWIQAECSTIDIKINKI